MSSRDDTARDGYSLIDAGGGRRLERFGEIVVDRPAPVLEAVGAHDPSAWDAADARFDRPQPGRRTAGEHSGGWWRRPGTPDAWTVSVGTCALELRFAAGGQVGLFPEHIDGARWLASHAARIDPAHDLGVLNLFGYTGLATVVLAQHGNPVTHVDASRTATEWARRNAQLSGLANAPVRWIVDDAEAFARRELRRGRTYAAVLLDPPTYGHGPRGRGPSGEPWRFESHIESLLGTCRSLIVPGGAMLLTTHTPGLSGEQLGTLLESSGVDRTVEHGPLELLAKSGVVLPLGAWARGIVR